jgi:hypothetical protein
MKPICYHVPRFLRGWYKDVLTICVTLGGFGSAFPASNSIIAFDAPGAGTAASQGTQAVAVSDSGDTTGLLADTNNVFHGSIRTADGQFTVFDAQGAGTTSYQGTEPNGIDSDGNVVGYYYDSNNVFHGFLRDPTGLIATIDAPNAGTAPTQGTNATQH